MKTFNLEEAAALLRMTPEGLRRKVVQGLIPAAKPGKRWCFLEEDLAEYLRSLYASNAKVSSSTQINRRTKWHSINEEGSITLNLDIPTTVGKYEKLLGLRKK